MTVRWHRRRLVRTPLTIMPVLVLLLGACGGDESTEAGSDGASYESPINEYMGFDQGVDFSDPEAAEAAFAEQQREINEQVVACMAAEGFEYIPQDHGDMIVFGEDAGPDGLVWGSDEWVAKYGFGISTQAFPQEIVGPELVGMDESMYMGEEDHQDPNEDYVNSLSEADREAFYETLYGNDPGPDIEEGMSDEEMEEAIAEWEENREFTGCEEKAWADSNFGGGQDAFYREFGDDMEDMWEGIESHPKIVEAERGIAECVSDKGYAYTTMREVYEQFDEKMQPLWEVAYAEPEVILSEEEMAAMSQQELEEFYGPQELSDEAKSQLAEIQAEEVGMATAVNECGGGFDANQDVYEEVRIEMERDFIEANKERLDAFLADQE